MRILLAFLLASAAHAAPDDALARELIKTSDMLEAWDLRGAEELSARMMREHEDEPAVLHVAGRVAFHQGDYARAVELLEKAAVRYGADDPSLGLARAAARETKGYVAVESAHFSVRTPPGKDELLAPYAVEALEAAYKNLAADFQHEVPEKIVVEVYEDVAGLSRVSGLTIKSIKTSGTIAICKYNRLMITSPKALAQGYAWLDTLGHEFVHLVVSQKSNNTVPIWIHEGLAKFSESRWRGEAGQGLSPFGEALLVKNARTGGRLITFAEMHPSMALLKSQEEAALAFTEVFTAIEWMHKRGGWTVLNKIIEELREGASDRQAVSRALGMPFEQFEREWKKSLKERKPRLPLAAAKADAHKLEFKDDAKKKGKTVNEDSGEWRGLPDRKAISYAHLGELLLARNRPAAAEIEYKKALDIVGTLPDPRLVRRYARTLFMQKKFPPAESALVESVQIHDEEAASHILLGEVYLATRQDDKAREHFTLANRIDPFDPLIHQALYAVAQRRGDNAELAREKRALELLSAPIAERTMARHGDAFISIRTRPVTHVYIDGEDTRLTTPIQKHRVRPGRHGIRLINEELGIDHSLSVDVNAGDTLDLEPDLTGSGKEH